MAAPVWRLDRTLATPALLQEALDLWMAERGAARVVRLPRAFAPSEFGPAAVGDALVIAVRAGELAWPIRLAQIAAVESAGRDWRLTLGLAEWLDAERIAAGSGARLLHAGAASPGRAHAATDEAQWRRLVREWRRYPGCEHVALYWPVLDASGTPARVAFDGPADDRARLVVEDDAGERLADAAFVAGGAAALDVPPAARYAFRLEGAGYPLATTRRGSAAASIREERAPYRLAGASPLELAQAGQYGAAAAAFARREPASLSAGEAWAYLLAASQTAAPAPYAELLQRAPAPPYEIAEALRRMPANAATDALSRLEALLAPATLQEALLSLAADCPPDRQASLTRALGRCLDAAAALRFARDQLARTGEASADLLAAALACLDAPSPDAAEVWRAAVAAAARRGEIETADRLLDEAHHWIAGPAAAEALADALEGLAAVWPSAAAVRAAWLRLARAHRLSGDAERAAMCLRRAAGGPDVASWEAERRLLANSAPF